jgi:dynein heavy chain, axonemal
MGSVLKIAEVVRSQIDKFKPKVPLMVALRKKGMKERHWNEVREALIKKLPESERETVPVLPTEDFTFKKALKLKLMNCIDTCVDVGER